MISVALVGLGDIALSGHLPALLRNPEVRLRGLVDPDDGKRARARAAAGGRVPTFVDLHGVLADQQVDAVVLATPPWVTGELTEHALRAGKYVLAEKPIATSVRDARVLSDLPPQQRNRLQVGLTYRHDPAIETLRGWIADGRLGSPMLVRAHIYDERRDAADLEHQARITGALAHGMPVMHEGSHVFDWLSVLLGALPDGLADAWALRTAPELPAPNLVGARLRYADATALVEFGWFTDSLPRCEISVLGDSGYALLDGYTFRLELHTAAGREVLDFAGDRMSRCFDRQLLRFVELVSGERDEPSPDLAAGLAALDISERVAHAATGTEVTPS